MSTPASRNAFTMQRIEALGDGLGVSQSMLHRWHERYGAEVGGGATRSHQ